MLLATAEGTLGGSALASWTPTILLLGAFAVAVAALFVFGRPDTARPWPVLRPLARVPAALHRITGVPGWAATAIGMSLFGLLVAGQGFYSDVAWHIALGRDEKLFTAPHTAILVGLLFILGGAVLGTFVATMDRITGTWRLGSLRIPRSLLPLWVLGLGAVSGFPLDEIWHSEYGIDVTMWSPTHMLMILGASFTGIAGWLVLAEAGVRPSDGRWGRGLHVVAAWLTLQGLMAPQGEFTFGVPQFGQIFHPILVCLAAGFALVVARLALGRGWAIGLALLGLALEVLLNLGEDGSPVDTRFGATFVVSALIVEAAARLLGTERLLRFAVACGVGIGTIGLAGEWLWNQGAYQPWTSALLPDAVIYGVVAATGAAVLGAATGRAISGGGASQPSVDRGLPGIALGAAGLAVLATVVLPLPRHVGDVHAALTVEPAGDGTAFVEVTLDPVDAADDARWFQATAWQGGGLVLAEMEPTGEPGTYRSERSVPVEGLWKSLVRLHRGDELMAVPIFLPRDAEIGEAEIPAVDRTMEFQPETDYLLRETTPGNSWLTYLVHGYLAVMAAVWMAALTFVVAGLGRRESAARASPLISGGRAGRA